jgi:hypothetical protein
LVVPAPAGRAVDRALARESLDKEEEREVSAAVLQNLAALTMMTPYLVPSRIQHQTIIFADRPSNCVADLDIVLPG